MEMKSDDTIVKTKRREHENDSWNIMSDALTCYTFCNLSNGKEIVFRVNFGSKLTATRSMNEIYFGEILNN